MIRSRCEWWVNTNQGTTFVYSLRRFMHLYVVRHGETWANAEHRYLASLDPELTALGRQQAQTLCEQLPENIDVLVVSPRLRAVQTASILNERLSDALCPWTDSGGK
ncbi:histidine phosphatase family protein [Pseudomonas sp. NPDC087358]|uniref:histidine phosphatase family protein n=1 Tax=Pseudomonas sp. NPDC087358 TaxID=3364439 RepID=UPI00384E9B20